MNPKYFAIAALLTSILLIASCGNKKGESGSSIFSSEKFDEAAFATTLTSWINKSTDSLPKRADNNLAALYQENDFHPLWLQNDGNANLTNQLLQDLENLQWDGLQLERYDIPSLKNQLKNFTENEDASLPEIVALDTAFTHTYLLAARHLMFGVLVPKQADSLWYHANDSGFHFTHVASVLKDKKYPALDSFRSKLTVYISLQKALKHFDALAADSAFFAAKQKLQGSKNVDSNVLFIIEKEPTSLPNVSFPEMDAKANSVAAYQSFYDLKPTGKLDSVVTSYLQRSPQQITKLIAANMERLRWLPRSFEDTFVIVNLPKMELDLMENGASTMHMNVVVGKPVRQTPVLGAIMKNVVINPPWGVPPTILKKDVLPGMLRSGGSYLRRKGLRAYDSRGHIVDAGSINASNYKRYNYKQEPGDRNALGYVKFNLPNKWDIYLHDTPHREDFVKNYRALSSGCIRLQQPKELAEYILVQLNGKKDFDQNKLDSIITTHKTKWETLKNKLPVHIVYLTAFDMGTGNGVRFARDIYKRDAKLMAALSE